MMKSRSLDMVMLTRRFSVGTGAACSISIIFRLMGATMKKPILAPSTKSPTAAMAPPLSFLFSCS